MKTLDRYLLIRLCSALAKTLIALVAFYVFIDLFTHREVAISKYNVPWSVVGRYYILFAPKMIYQVAPLAMLVSALLVLGETAQHNEITAALAGGISLRRFSRIPILVALGFALSLFAMEQVFGADATREALEIEDTYFSRNPDIARGGISWANLTGDWTCHVRKFNRIALTGEDILIHSIREDGIEQIEANRIYWDQSQGRWLIEDGWWRRFPTDFSEARTTRVTQCPAPFSENPDQLFALEKPTDTKTARELRDAIAYAEAHSMPAGRLLADYYAKYSWPALCFVMIGLAIPFAMRLRRGGLAISFGASIAIAMGYLMVFYAAMSMGHAGRLSPEVAAWLANAVFFTAGAILFLRTPT
ncbi:MAG: LptF/LptG family permease [Candidatus Hydrogenedentes bacterium]|nr:LptF/LptG family permease [Candidatus Hydrogenedentota bacterium]